MNDDNININNNKLINIIEINTYIKHLTKQTRKNGRRIVIRINKIKRIFNVFKNNQ